MMDHALIFFLVSRCNNCGRSMHKDCISLLSKCGTNTIPPVPPRPPSMQLPIPLLADNRSREQKPNENSKFKLSFSLQV